MTDIKNEKKSNTPVALVHKILPQSFVDGPGNRAVVFLQGCNLRCKYCHNPQTIQLCTSCGACVDGCPAGALSMVDGKVLWDAKLCVDCEACEKICPYLSSPRVSRYTAQELWDELKRYTPFINGITVSGGEPTEQLDFLEAFFQVVKENSQLNTLIESNGNLNHQRLKNFLPWLDMVMMDLKAFDQETHDWLTGTDNFQVLETIRFLAEQKKLIAVRTTVIQGINDQPEIIREASRFIAKIDPQIEMVFLRFRPHGTRGEAQNWKSPTDAQLDNMVKIAKEEGLQKASHSL